MAVELCDMDFVTDVDGSIAVLLVIPSLLWLRLFNCYLQYIVI